MLSISDFRESFQQASRSGRPCSDTTATP
jgi:hypothetical protein